MKLLPYFHFSLMPSLLCWFAGCNHLLCLLMSPQTSSLELLPECSPPSSAVSLVLPISVLLFAYRVLPSVLLSLLQKPLPQLAWSPLNPALFPLLPSLLSCCHAWWHKHASVQPQSQLAQWSHMWVTVVLKVGLWCLGARVLTNIGMVTKPGDYRASHCNLKVTCRDGHKTR